MFERKQLTLSLGAIYDKSVLFASQDMHLGSEYI